MTGDHIETAKYVALKSGIISEQEIDQPGVCMTGDEFIQQIGQYEREWDSAIQQYRIKFSDDE